MAFYLMKTYAKALFHLLQELTSKLTASIFIQSQCSKVSFNEMEAPAANSQDGFALTGQEGFVL